MKKYLLVIFFIHGALTASIEVDQQDKIEAEAQPTQFGTMMGMGMNPMMMGGMNPMMMGGMNPMMGMGMNPMMMGGMNPMMGMGMGSCGGCSCSGCMIPWMPCLPVCNPCCCNGDNKCNEEEVTDAPVEPAPDMHGPEDGTPIWMLPNNIPERNFPNIPEANYPPDIIVRM